MDQWTDYYKRAIRRREKIVVELPDIPDAPFLTMEEAAAALGLTCRSLRNWVYERVIPRPAKWEKYRRRVCKAPFRREFVKAIREAMVIWKSTPGLRRDDFQNLCHKMAWGYR